MRPLLGRTLDDRNLVLLGPTIQAPAEAASQAHQMGVVQVVIGPIQSSPPGAKPARGAAHGEVGIQHDAIHAIVGALQEISVVLAKRVQHEFLPRNGETMRKPVILQLPRQGPFLPGNVPEEA